MDNVKSFLVEIMAPTISKAIPSGQSFWANALTYKVSSDHYENLMKDLLKQVGNLIGNDFPDMKMQTLWGTSMPEGGFCELMIAPTGENSSIALGWSLFGAKLEPYIMLPDTRQIEFAALSDVVVFLQNEDEQLQKIAGSSAPTIKKALNTLGYKMVFPEPSNLKLAVKKINLNVVS